MQFWLTRTCCRSQAILIISACAYVYLRSLLLPREQALQMHQKIALTGLSTTRMFLRHPHAPHRTNVIKRARAYLNVAH